ncbi:MAG: hypothetical protein M1812_000254 [Candelaria pacifica]|nr:MAG: hypothetical protein M1812_000254 [Candelaria pacifica]
MSGSFLRPTSSKRSRSRSRSSQRSFTLSPLRRSSEEQTLGRDEGNLRVPAFLRQTKAEIQAKFTELEWLQRNRLLQGCQDPNPSSQWAQDSSPEVMARNRYLNVRPWTNRRIHLQVPEGHSDYVNASPIVLQSAKTEKASRFIATQGPKKGQLNHIWQMIWHETSEVAVVIMLTQTSEAGREKCFQYFPMDFENDNFSITGEDEFDDGFKANVKILELTVDAASRSTIRKLLLTLGDETKVVWHLLFAGWPDYSIPEGDDRAALLELIKISATKNSNPENPRIVHCSAGVGRSGTFIALDHLLGELERGGFSDLAQGVDPVYDTINNMREQRMSMVHAETQLNFVYQVLKEQWVKINPDDTNSSPTRINPSSSSGHTNRSHKVARLAAEANADMEENVLKSTGAAAVD